MKRSSSECYLFNDKNKRSYVLFIIISWFCTSNEMI